MSSLNHVRRWNGTEWIPISSEEAAKEYHFTCPAENRQFVCALCGQYVSFVVGVRQEPHFRHSAAEKSKDCLERSHGINLAHIDLVREHHLPIKIKNAAYSHFSFELGFPKLPGELLDHISKIHISSANSKEETHIYAGQRLVLDGMTYLSVGEEPSVFYDICVEGADASLRKYWPTRTRGVKNGTLFIKNTGRMLPPHSDVTVGEIYYLLHHRSICTPCSGITVRPVTHRYTESKTWRIYEVCALSYTEDVARFFLDLEGYRLTPRPIFLLPFFPLCAMDDMTVHFHGEQLVFHMRGVSRVQTQPRIPLTEISCGADSKLISFCTTEDHLRVVAGHMSALVEFDCWRATGASAMDAPPVCVMDASGAEVQGGVVAHLPRGGLRIHTHYDGTVIQYRNGIVAAQEKLAANREIRWDRMTYGTELQIVIGCDVLWALRLERPCVQLSRSVEHFLHCLQRDRGRRIKPPHNLAILIYELKAYPALCTWIRQCTRSGWMSERAYKKLKTFADRVRGRDTA